MWNHEKRRGWPFCTSTTQWLVAIGHEYNNTYIKDRNKLSYDCPFVVVEFELAEFFESLISGYTVDGLPVFDSELHHVMG
jgi:hypothetical protein